MATNTAPVKWAQRSDSIYVTINLPDVKEEQIDLSSTALKFRYAPVLPETIRSKAV